MWFSVFCEVGPTLRDFISHSVSLQSCTMHESPQWNFTSLNEFISSPPYILFHNTVFLTDLPVSVSEIEKNYVLLPLRQPLVPQAVSHLHLMSEAWVRRCARPFRIWEGHTDTATGFSPSTSVSPVSIIPPLLHIHSFIYHPRCIMFFSQYFSFPLSVSFHHCSILIHPSTTHAV